MHKDKEWRFCFDSWEDSGVNNLSGKSGEHWFGQTFHEGLLTQPSLWMNYICQLWRLPIKKMHRNMTWQLTLSNKKERDFPPHCSYQQTPSSMRRQWKHNASALTSPSWGCIMAPIVKVPKVGVGGWKLFFLIIEHRSDLSVTLSWVTSAQQPHSTVVPHSGIPLIHLPLALGFLSLPYLLLNGGKNLNHN
jgi:hypothetical protein